MDSILFPDKRTPVDLSDPDQASLFESPTEKLPKPAYQPTSITSREAANKIAPKVRGLQLDIMRWLDEVGDGTRKECAREKARGGTGIPINVVTPRVHELIYELGFVREVQSLLQPVKGSESVGIQRRDGSAVLVLTRAGREYLEQRSAA